MFAFDVTFVVIGVGGTLSARENTSLLRFAPTAYSSMSTLPVEEDMDEEPDFSEVLQLSTAVGFMILIWSQIERNLDNCVYAAYKFANGAPLARKKKIPKAFDSKRKFLIKCFNELPLLAEFKKEGLRILAEAVLIATQRNNFSHGTLDDINPTNGTFNFHRLNHGEQTHSVVQFNFNPGLQWPTLEKSLMDLYVDSAYLSAAFSKRFLMSRK